MSTYGWPGIWWCAAIPAICCCRAPATATPSADASATHCACNEVQPFHRGTGAGSSGVAGTECVESCVDCALLERHPCHQRQEPAATTCRKSISIYFSFFRHISHREGRIGRHATSVVMPHRSDFFVCLDQILSLASQSFIPRDKSFDPTSNLVDLG